MTRTRRVLCVETGQVFNSMVEAGEFVGVPGACISAAVRGKTGTSAGYHWKYAPDDLQSTSGWKTVPVRRKRGRPRKTDEVDLPPKVERPRSKPSMTIYAVQEEARRRTEQTGRYVRYKDIQIEETLAMIRARGKQRQAEKEGKGMNILIKILLTAFVAYILALLLFCLMPGATPEPAPAPEPVVIETTTTTAPTTTTTTTTAPTMPSKAPHYPITEKERDLVERVVMAEAGAEPYVGQLAVAQCILNASITQGKTLSRVVIDLKYTSDRPNPSDSVKEAVSAVFDDGVKVFDYDVLYFYAPAMVTSAWHESQEYVVTIEGHKFFKEAK